MKYTNTALELNPVEASYGSILDTYCIELEEHIRNNKTDWLLDSSKMEAYKA